MPLFLGGNNIPMFTLIISSEPGTDLAGVNWQHVTPVNLTTPMTLQPFMGVANCFVSNLVYWFDCHPWLCLDQCHDYPDNHHAPAQQPFFAIKSILHGQKYFFAIKSIPCHQH